MPRYRVNEKTYNLPEDKVESFLVKYPNAELIVEDQTSQDIPSEDLLDPTTFQADAAAGAGVVSQPIQAPDMELVSEDISLDLPEVKEPEQKKTILDEILNSEAIKKLKAGGLRVGSNISQIPAFINRLKLTTAQLFVPDEKLEEFKKLDSQTQDRIAQAMGSLTGSSVPDIGAAGFIGLEAGKKLKKDAAKIENTLKQYDTTISQDIVSGDFSQAIYRTFNEVVGTIPSIAQAMIPYVGIPSIVAGSAADYSTDALAEGKKLDAANMAASTLTGLSEGMLEVTTRKIGKGLFKNLLGKDKSVIEKTLKDAALQVVKEAGQEGFSESTTEILNRTIDAIYFNRGDEFDNIWPELADVFIIGAAAGGGMSGTGGTGALINRAVQVNSINKTLEQNNSSSVLDEFELNPSSDKSINIAKNKYSGNILDIELRKKVSNGDISTEQSEAIKQKFNITQKNVKIANDLNITEDLFKETVDLLNERQDVVSEIAKAGENKSLVQTQNNRLKEIDSRLSDISAENQLKITTEKVTDIIKGIESINIEIAKDQEQADKIAEDKNLQKKASVEQGYILQDAKTGEQTIVINEEVAKKDFAVNVAAHELLHGILFKTIVDSPQTAVNLGNALKLELDKIDAGKVKDSKFKERLELYKQDPDAIVGEETLTLFSDAIATGDLAFEENLFTKIGDTIRRILQRAGLTGIKFNTGRDVYNFIKDYNKSITKGQLTKAQAKAVTEGIKGELVTPKVEQVDEQIVKEARSEEASQDVQRIYDEQGPAGAFEIIEKFKPITSKLVERRSEAPNFDRQLLTDEIETGKRGILDLINEYNPESGVPLAAYINKFLPARAIEASKRVLGEEFTEDVAEARGVVAAEVTDDVTVEKEVRGVRKPTETTRFSETALSQLGVETKAQAEKQISDATKEAFKGKEITRFGETRNIPQAVADIYGKMFGVNPQTIVDKRRNYQKTDAEGLTRIKQYLIDNAPSDFARLPKTKDAFGKGTFIPKNVADALYTDGKLTGTLKDYLDLIRQRPVKPIYRDRVGQTIRGLFNTSIRNRMLEDLIPEPAKRAQAGAKFSLSDKVDINIDEETFFQIYARYQKGDKTLPKKQQQIVEDYIAKSALEESDKGKSAQQFTKSIKSSDLPSELKQGTWTLSDKKFKQNEEALKDFDKQADNLSSQIPLTANIANKNRNIVLGLFAGHYNIVGSDMAKVASSFKKGILSNLNTDKSSVLSKETLSRWKNFPWDNLKSSYAYENRNALKKINESSSFKEQQNIARKTFNSDQGKASLELYDLWNTTLQEWLYSSEPGSKEFSDKANYILKLKKSNASIGTTGERILAPPGYVFLPGKSIAGTIKFEHLKSSSQQSSESAMLVLQNKWKDEGKNNIKAYNGIWGLLDDFNIIDKQTGKVNDSSIFRFAENLELAKNIYSVESNFTKTLYNDIVDKVGKKAVKQFESDQSKLFNANNNKLPKTVKLSKSKNTLDVLETMEDLDKQAKEANKIFYNSIDLNKDFNDIIEAKTGIASEKRYGKAKAQVAGASRGKAIKFVPYSAQDFVGLLYETLSKGKLGDAQMAWYQENLIRPFAKAMNELSSARLAMMNDYRALKKELKIVPKDLRKKVPGEPWTKEQAVRVYVWNIQGMDIPGISKADLKDLTEYVNGDRELQVFANQLIAIQKGDGYPKPKDSWVSGSISTDLLQGLNTVKRAKYLEQWQENVDKIFSKENKNKLQAAYGEKYVKALENSLQRMKTGRNRTFSDDSLTGRFTDWLQGSVGAIMFFNTRSALLQTISAVNFINFTDNNPISAAKAFGNQKQYWKDFTYLINSDFLKERRAGLRMNVSESDIADMAKQEGPRGVINKLLQLGFAPTQIADSFAIASGGATFYRNRVKTYLKDGLDQKAAEQKAFEDFRENAEESQQSSRPDRISMQQAGPLGRLILAFANTPAQYARLTDKAIRDLKNNRGDAKTNISKIIYYMAVQNLIFNAVQQALFAMAFGDEEEEDEKKQEKYLGIVNGMADSILRGTGFAGAAISVGKNSVLRIIKEAEKKRPKFEKVGYELTKISPPISAKLSRINQAARAYQWNKEEMKTKGFSLDNPAYLAGGNVVSALTNIPLDRAVKKVNNVVKATDSDLELWERLALFGGWQDWEIGLKEETKTNKPQPRKVKSKGIKSRSFKRREF